MTGPVQNTPLHLVLGGRPAPVVPVAPVYENLGALQFHGMQLRWRLWRARLDEAAAELLPLDYQTYLQVELGTRTEILDRWYPPPAWLQLPVNRTPEEIAGCALARRGEDLFWLSPEGAATWIPPNRQRYHEHLAGEKRHPYADLWERGHQADRSDRAAGPRDQLAPAPAPAPAQAQALADSQQYDVSRALIQRYPSLPLYVYSGSPYNSLLGAFGFQEMMAVLAERPRAAHAILESSLPRSTARLAAARALGVSIMFVEECLSSADIISPAMYREFAFPYTRETLQYYEGLGFRTVLYFSGNLMPVLEDLKRLPFTALSFEEDRKGYGIDLAEVRRVLGPDRVLFGNLDALFVEKATDEELLAEVRRQSQVAGADGNFVVSLGSPFTPDTALDRVRLVCESTRLI